MLAIVVASVLVVLAVALAAFTEFESFASLYDAEYVGAKACGDCHVEIYPAWQRSPHANMARPATGDSVVGAFDDATWELPATARRTGDVDPAARMYRLDGSYFMALRHPDTQELVPFRIDYVAGYQYRQTYMTREDGGVLRRLPLQWSAERQEFFPYWNFQDGTTPTLVDLWQQMGYLNSAWNLFCARCHTTKLTVTDKDEAHTHAETRWVDDGIACEACHGPGSQHVNYMRGNPVNRIVAFLNNRVRDQPVAYIANAPKLAKGEALSVCARCHGPDIFRKTMDTYRTYEPGYSREGRINDLSPHFREVPLDPDRSFPTLETWADGRPKGIGMLFRSFIESTCYEAAEVRCFDCHNPHDNKQPARPGLLDASIQSNAYCLDCHGQIQAGAHSAHVEGTPGSFCYDCHMPKHIMNAATGVRRYVRSHTMSSIPDARPTIQHGNAGAPNACNDCHTDRSPEWVMTELERRRGPQPVVNDRVTERNSGMTGQLAR